jgi:hypothetical protein
MNETERKPGQDIVTIGGVEYRVKLTYGTIMRIFETYWNHGFKEGDVIPVNFFVWVLWKVIEKRGIWPFRKPFRSIHHLKKSILLDEMPLLVQFIQTRIFQVRLGEKKGGSRRKGKKPQS